VARGLSHFQSRGFDSGRNAGYQLLLPLRSTVGAAVTRAISLSLIWYRRFCSAWEWPRCTPPPVLTVRHHGETLHRNGRGAPKKVRHIALEELGCKITHLPPCLHGLTLANLVFRRELWLPCNLLFGAPPKNEWPTIDHVANLVDHLHDIHNYACQHLKLASDQMKTCQTEWPTVWATTSAINCGSITQPTWKGNRPSSNPQRRACKRQQPTQMMWYTGYRGTLDQGWWWYIWTDWKDITEPLGMSGLKEEAAWAVVE
jgi:hypothetical protein